ncbi:MULTISPECIES: hypothetical protein [unclassified Nostoc]|uniref:hypothetical protein n=1 Tax=unclassified Nostoc TaxID=2593658 RepID=UPI0025AB1633|nr:MULTISPECIES: hypothetical protein [unclassified Nostoc]MDM9581635.1 hypothetical protein [Nostoc sp. GT001]MDZ7947039.1 hypothetical protein [Nostoc sp. EfeVER01]MDZ7991463.1 hypothetical protein [Nostoc sp. EspVER01]
MYRFVGWVERSETQQSPENVGFRSSTQPTRSAFLGLTEQYWGAEILRITN